jgi:two-component system cell cycle sensor histidine kinase/response regulator CckA
MAQPPGRPDVGRALRFAPDAPSVLEFILSSLSDGVIVARPNGRIILFNAAAERLLGTAPTNVPPAEWSTRFHLYLPDKVTLFPAEQLPLARAIRGETARDVEMFVHNPAVPEGLWLSVSATPLQDAAGRLRGGVAVIRDVGERKRSEENLLRERDWVSAVVETVASLVLVLDRSGRIVRFNRACEAATGYTFKDVRGRCVWDLFLLPEEGATVRHVFDTLCAGDFPNQHENHWVAKDGTRRLIAWSNTALVDAGGKVEFIIATGTDITSRKRAEEELRQANHTLKVIIDTSPLAIMAVDLEGRVRSWNRAAEQMFGWLEQEVVGRPCPIVTEEDEAFFRASLTRLEQGETLAGAERQGRRKNGTLVDVALWNAPHRNAEGNVGAGIFVMADMTDRRRLEEQFLQAQKMEAVGRLAGGVAHDFNNLLTVIGGYARMLADSVPADSPFRDPVEEIVRAGDSAAALTSQLLSFSRRQIVTPQVLELNALVAGMDKMLHRLLGEDIEMVTALAPRLPNVKVDAGQFQQVLMNLVVNARDAMPQGGTITVETKVAGFSEVSPEGIAPGRYVLLSVNDTGRGMTEETRMHAFEPFFTTKARGKGTGLGLSTVYGIVKQAGGEITLITAPGEGTTFNIYLPAADAAADAAAGGSPVPEARRGTETVLLVEDEAGLRKLIRQVLEGHGYTVLQAANFRDAIEWCDRHSGPIHLFLTDLVMPGMSGQDLAREVTRLRPHLKVLYMSGHTDHAVFENGLLNNGIAFLQKPFTPSTLLAKLREVLDAR